jgi:hypothetical protein
MMAPRWPEVMKHPEYPHENGNRKRIVAKLLLDMAMLQDLLDETDIAPSFS